MQHRRARFICDSSLIAGLLLTALAAGCNSAARYDIVAPASARGPIGQNAGPIVTRDGIDYEIFQAQEKMIVRFVNRTGQTLNVADQSVIFDAGGRRFAVEVQAVEPDQGGRVVLPPTIPVDQVRPVSVASEVHVGGVDEGGLIGTRRDIEMNNAAGGSIGAAAAPSPGFRWPVNAQVRVRLVYNIGESADELTHEWTLRRTR